MKTITISSLQIHSITTDLGYVVFMPIKGLEYPSVRMQPFDRPGEHGAVVPNQFYGGRTILLNGRISGSTIAQFLINRRTLSNALSILQDSLNIAQPLLLQFTTLDNLSLQTYCYVTKQPEFTDKSLNHCTFLIELFCPDPNLYDQSLQMSTVSIPIGGGVVYPVIYPVTYAAKTGGTVTIFQAGDSYMFPSVTFNGPLTSPILNNQTTGAVFSIGYSLLTGDVLVVDMDKKTMVLNGNNAMQYFNLNNTWISLQPGNNLISLASGLSADTGSATINFRNSYLGV